MESFAGASLVNLLLQFARQAQGNMNSGEEMRTFGKVKSGTSTTILEISPVLALAFKCYLQNSNGRNMNDFYVFKEMIISLKEQNSAELNPTGQNLAEILQRFSPTEMLDNMYIHKNHNLNFAFYNLVCHGGYSPNFGHFTLPINIEIWFFTPHGDVVECQDYTDKIFTYFDTLKYDKKFLMGSLSFEKSKIGSIEIIKPDDKCYNYQLQEFTPQEVYGWSVNANSARSLSLHGLTRLIPDFESYGFGQSFKYLSDFVEFISNVTQSRRRNEYVILAACCCRK